MAEPKRLVTPLTADQARSLRAGDAVLISGVIYTARDAAHLRLCRLIEEGQSLPVDLRDQIVYFVGPTPAPPGRPLGSAGPTTSSRMDAFSPVLYAHGLRATIGKGYRNETVRRALQDHGAVHLAALGGAGALLAQCIEAAEVVAYPELGTEAIRRLTVRDFPATVAYDAHGRTVYRVVPDRD